LIQVPSSLREFSTNDGLAADESSDRPSAARSRRRPKIRGALPLFLAGRDRLRLEAPDPAVRALAAELWSAADDGAAAPGDLRLRVDVVEATTEGDPEEALRWEVSELETRLDAPGLSTSVRPREGRASAAVSRPLLRSRPGLVARLALEAPVTAMKMRSMQLLHAGAVVGPAGAAVIRGAAGAGKSTLVAACHLAGLGFLGDESLLVDRASPDRLEATLRDLVVTPESARLLGLDAASVPAFSGGERKRRVLLPERRVPGDRLATRVATLLLGPREPGPARLEPLAGPRFLEAFAAAEIPQERVYGGAPEETARAWNGRGTFLLEGAADLPGAVARVRDLVHGITRR
jgi:hypothetical protein